MGINIRNVEGQLVCSCCGACSFQPRLVVNLEKLAIEWMNLHGKPIHVNSGYRCAKHNAAIPGSAKNSRHMLGQAVDCAIKKAYQDEFIRLARSCGFNGIGIYETFVHIDVRAIPCEPWHG